jgi:hypothetical protein
LFAKIKKGLMFGSGKFTAVNKLSLHFLSEFDFDFLFSGNYTLKVYPVIPFLMLHT